MADKKPLSVAALRGWVESTGTDGLRAIRRARPRLERTGDRELLPWAALALSRLAQVEPVPSAVRALERVRSSVCDDALRARLALELALHESDLDRARALAEEAAQSGQPDVSLLARLRLARLAQRRGELARARAILHDVRASQPADRRDRVGASLDVLEAIQALAEGRTSTALDQFERAFRWAAGAEADAEASEVAGMIGNALHAMGDLRRASRWYAYAVRHARKCGATTTAAIFELYLGWARHEAGDRAAAARSYARALRGLPELPFRLHAEGLRALLSKGPRRHAEVARMASELERNHDSSRARALATLAVATDAVEEAAEASAKVAALNLLRLAAALAFDPTSDDERIALRMARSQFDRAVARASRQRADVRVAIDGSAFSRGVRRVSLLKYPVLARVLVATARATLEERAITTDDLVAAGWPDDRIRADAARHRVQVAISTLRVKGAPIVRSGDGYVLAGSIGLLRPQN